MKARPKKSSKKYEAPKLKAHGRFKDLTQTKGGTKSDGSGKPASRINGQST